MSYFRNAADGTDRFVSNAKVETWSCSNIDLNGDSTKRTILKTRCLPLGDCNAGPFDSKDTNSYHLYYKDTDTGCRNNFELTKWKHLCDTCMNATHALEFSERVNSKRSNLCFLFNDNLIFQRNQLCNSNINACTPSTDNMVYVVPKINIGEDSTAPYWKDMYVTYFAFLIQK